MGFKPKQLLERGFLKPQDTAKLKRVLFEACCRRDIRADSEEGRDLALRVLALYNAGMTDEADLMDAVAFAVRSSG